MDRADKQIPHSLTQDASNAGRAMIGRRARDSSPIISFLSLFQFSQQLYLTSRYFSLEVKANVKELAMNTNHLYDSLGRKTKKKILMIDNYDYIVLSNSLLYDGNNDNIQRKRKHPCVVDTDGSQDYFHAFFFFLYQWGNRLIPKDSNVHDTQKLKQKDEKKVDITQRSWSDLA